VKRIVLVLCAACGGSDPITVPDSGLPATAVSCDQPAGGHVTGELDSDRTPIRYGDVTPMLFPGSTDSPAILRLVGMNHTLDFYLPSSSSGTPPSPGEYSYSAHAAIPNTMDTISAPSMFIVDASEWPAEVSQRCFAGRFAVTFEGRGSLFGWFRVP
jgi:hypothetical protein